ncbi:prevent-host-death family protein [Stella humosa]|uniref:Antitoxin n=1 Tax=Stella humosa TaxID=94 RepID=A0A3N1MC96_9PROT|nr:type II toxin-antitoxin system prevent-host-death family antitoxin [Stella humosa]ROQ01218.1 prevent-host-death family protein [Stella humosa]BBK31592.1 antitoxin [Stella humosa]
MTTVGAFEAKTHLSALLERVSRGEEITITRHGKVVARLVPPEVDAHRGVDQVIDAILAARKGRTLGGLSVRDLRDQGRR